MFHKLGGTPKSETQQITPSHLWFSQWNSSFHGTTFVTRSPPITPIRCMILSISTVVIQNMMARSSPIGFSLVGQLSSSVSRSSMPDHCANHEDRKNTRVGSHLAMCSQTPPL
ncbi:hypothetical protein Scep_007753 [Stephania cephalantha]|uniref:Uncharacterized protein n=1 Tax=Stephania cephalantha TaxID=152367 RepID=A0AAP0KAH4_9MAGN